MKNNQHSIEHLVRPMCLEDIEQVGDIEQEAFPTQWPRTSFRKELNNRLAHYFVVCSPHAHKPLNTVCNAPSRSAPPSHSSWLSRLLKLSPFSYKQRPEIVKREIIAFAGIWLMVDEAHIINIAVREAYRGYGFGELMIIATIEKAIALKARYVTLEVRASNFAAQNLYHKYGFNEAGLRNKYYSDNHEDALIMTTNDITSQSYLNEFKRQNNIFFQNHPDYRLTLWQT